MTYELVRLMRCFSQEVGCVVQVNSGVASKLEFLWSCLIGHFDGVVGLELELDLAV